MPFDSSDLRRRGIPTGRSTRELESIRFDEIVYLTAEGIAEAQTKLDLNTAEVLETLGETRVENLPRTVTREIQPDGTIETETETATRSLLELGFTPARYQFSETTIEVEMDLKITEEETTDREEEGTRYGIYGGTYEVTEERKYDRSVEANAKVTTTIEPVPMPVDVTPEETYTRTDEESE